MARILRMVKRDQPERQERCHSVVTTANSTEATG